MAKILHTNDFNSHNIICGSGKTIKKGGIVETLLDQKQQCFFNDRKTHIYIQQREHIRLLI